MDALDREIASQLYTQLGTYLLPILQRADAASMAASIEARVPFLDHRLVELGLAIPIAEKLRCSRFSLRPKGKYILKRVAERYLPHSIVHTAKRSFNMPSHFYNIPWPKAWLAEGFVMRSYNLNASEFSTWLDTADTKNRILALNLEIWGQLFQRRRSLQDVEQELKGVRPAASSGKVPELSWH
jgi:asparagine synthase (glutamine-hydrolysing)